MTRKQICDYWYSLYYFEIITLSAKYKREEAIIKALDMIKNPTKYSRTFDYGATGYIQIKWLKAFLKRLLSQSICTPSLTSMLIS